MQSSVLFDAITTRFIFKDTSNNYLYNKYYIGLPVYDKAINDKLVKIVTINPNTFTDLSYINKQPGIYSEFAFNKIILYTARGSLQMALKNEFMLHPGILELSMDLTNNRINNEIVTIYENGHNLGDHKLIIDNCEDYTQLIAALNKILQDQNKKSEFIVNFISGLVNTFKEIDIGSNKSYIDCMNDCFEGETERLLAKIIGSLILDKLNLLSYDFKNDILPYTMNNNITYFADYIYYMAIRNIIRNIICRRSDSAIEYLEDDSVLIKFSIVSNETKKNFELKIHDFCEFCHCF